MSYHMMSFYHSMSFYHKVIFGFFAFLLIFAVLLPAAYQLVGVIRLLLQRRNWRRLKPIIATITLQAVQGLPNPTRYVLANVLTERPGMGKINAIPAALSHLASAVDSPVRILRSLSYLSVLVGLFGTVSLLAITLWGVDQISDLKPEQLQFIYPINAIAIFVAIIIYILHGISGWYGDRLLLSASETLGGLHADLPDDEGDPHLVRALESVAVKFKEWGEEAYAQHQQQSDALVNEMRGLGEAIREMMDRMIATMKTEEEGIIPLLKTQDEKVELLSQRLDERFRDLAKPLLEARPILEQWQQSTQELGRVVLELGQADLPGQTASLGRATEGLAAAVTNLPKGVRREFQGIGQVIGTAVQEAVQSGWEGIITQPLNELNSTVSSLVEIQTKLYASLDKLPLDVAQRVAESITATWGQTAQATLHNLTGIMTQLTDNQKSLQDTMDKVPPIVAQGVAGSIRPLIEADLPGRFRELAESVAQLGQIAQNLPTAIRSSMRDTNDSIEQAITTSLQGGLGEELGASTEILRALLKAVREKQQSQNSELERLGGRIGGQLESLPVLVGHSVAEGVGATLQNLVSGPLQDLKETLDKLENTLRDSKPILSPPEAPPPPEESNWVGRFFGKNR
jgi:hypothetical protein